MPAALAQALGQRCCRIGNLFGLLAATNGDDDDLVRGELRGKDEALVVSVSHDHAADHAGAHSPGGGVAQAKGTVLGRVLDAEGPGEVLGHVVRGALLQRAAVPHHPLDGEGACRARETLAGGLLALDYRHGTDLAGGLRVDVERKHRLAHRVGLIGVRGVPFLPQEFGRAQEHPRPQLPADDVGPLVKEHGQVAVRADPLGHHLADDRLARWPDDQGLFEFLAARVGDDG